MSRAHGANWQRSSFQLAALHFDRQTADAGCFRVLRVQKHHFDELKNAFESTGLLIN